MPTVKRSKPKNSFLKTVLLRCINKLWVIWFKHEYVVVCIEDLFTTTYRLLPQTPIYIFLSLFYHPHINSPLYLVTNLTTFSSWVRTSKQECQNVKNCSKRECLKVGGGGGRLGNLIQRGRNRELENTFGYQREDSLVIWNSLLFFCCKLFLDLLAIWKLSPCERSE